jgi:hypothetical protein
MAKVSRKAEAMAHAQEMIDAHIDDDSDDTIFNTKSLKKALISLWALGYSDGYAAKTKAVKERKRKP